MSEESWRRCVCATKAAECSEMINCSHVVLMTVIMDETEVWWRQYMSSVHEGCFFEKHTERCQFASGKDQKCVSDTEARKDYSSGSSYEVFKQRYKSTTGVLKQRYKSTKRTPLY